ncbi:1481_t:CDS:1 [Funneliformis geosporum]|uniref:1481_t:CDS:1 n=1 Tax=Funneliformis geosporum TaxID=1117311 RepID=A0A9W4SG76_9GLOM|nr:1481_t:CDS:1 [Funneliformis geosporum]
MPKEKELPLILYFYEKDKSVSLEQVFAKHPLEESGGRNKSRKNYFIDRGGVKFFFQLDHVDLERSWGLEIGLDDDDQIPTQFNYLIVDKVLPIQNSVSPNSEVNKHIKELHFYTKKIMNISNNF